MATLRLWWKSTRKPDLPMQTIHINNDYDKKETFQPQREVCMESIKISQPLLQFFFF